METMDRETERAYVDAGMAPIGPYVARYGATPAPAIFRRPPSFMTLFRGWVQDGCPKAGEPWPDFTPVSPQRAPAVRPSRKALYVCLALAAAFLGLLNATKPARSQEFHRAPVVIVVPGYIGRAPIVAGTADTADVLHESPAEAEARLTEWEGKCGATFYTNPANYARAARVAKRCGGRVQ